MKVSHGIGQYQDTVSPNVSLRIPMAMIAESQRFHKEAPEIHPASQDMARWVSSLLTAVFLQDGVGYHRTFGAERRMADAPATMDMLTNAMEVYIENGLGRDPAEEANKLSNWLSAVAEMKGKGIENKADFDAADIDQIAISFGRELTDAEIKALQFFADNNSVNEDGDSVWETWTALHDDRGGVILELRDNTTFDDPTEEIRREYKEKLPKEGKTPPSTYDWLEKKLGKKKARE